MAGATAITIRGSGFVASSTVTIGHSAATNVTLVDATTITATTGPASASAATVTVTGYAGASGTVANGFTYVAPATFTDDPLVAGTTVVKAQHLFEPRQAVDSLWAVAGLPAATWTDATVTAAVTIVQAMHIAELRARLDEAQTALGYAMVPYTDPGLTAGVTPVKAVHLQELRATIRRVTG